MQGGLGRVRHRKSLHQCDALAETALKSSQTILELWITLRQQLPHNDLLALAAAPQHRAKVATAFVQAFDEVKRCKALHHMAESSPYTMSVDDFLSSVKDFLLESDELVDYDAEEMELDETVPQANGLTDAPSAGTESPAAASSAPSPAGSTPTSDAPTGLANTRDTNGGNASAGAAKGTANPAAAAPAASSESDSVAQVVLKVSVVFK